MITLAPMDVADIPQVAAIDRLSFPIPWPPDAYRKEILGNAHAHFFVALNGEARQWRRWFGLKAQRNVIGFAGYWFIIDEAHQLTPPAFNALLKILEEPPAHVIFILATTEFEKIPPTIASRAQRFHFRKVSVVEIALKLKTIVAEEKMRVTDDALELIAASAEGSFRDAESLLDQLTSLEERVTVESVEKIIGKVGFARTTALAELILAQNLSGALQYVASIQSEGYNIIDLTKELIHYLRRALTLRYDADIAGLFAGELTERELTALKKHSAGMDGATHVPLLKSLIRAYADMRYSPFASVPLEVALIEHLAKK